MQQSGDLLTGLRSQSMSSLMIQVFVILAVALGIASVLAVSVVQKAREIGILHRRDQVPTPAVQAFRREPRNQEIFEGIADDYREINERTFRLLAIFMPGVKLVGNLTTGVVLLYGGYRVLHGDMTIGTLTAFLLYLRMFFEPMQEISQFFNTFQSASSALEKLAGVLAEKPGIADPAHPVRLGEVRGEIAFHDVRFSYVPDRPVLPGLSLTVPPGQTVALVGTTGAGKTTIAKLIARFYDPDSGSVTLDGIDLRSLAQSGLRRHVVMVTQENFLFSGTVADNIRFGRPTASDAEVGAAAAAVGADTHIAAMVRLVEGAQEQKAAAQRLADRIAAVFVPAVFVIAALTATIAARFLTMRKLVTSPPSTVAWTSAGGTTPSSRSRLQ